MKELRNSEQVTQTVGTVSRARGFINKTIGKIVQYSCLATIQPSIHLKYVVTSVWSRTLLVELIFVFRKSNLLDEWGTNSGKKVSRNSISNLHTQIRILKVRRNFAKRTVSINNLATVIKGRANQRTDIHVSYEWLYFIPTYCVVSNMEIRPKPRIWPFGFWPSRPS